MLTEYSGTVFEPILESAIEKITERLPDRRKIELADLSGIVKFKPSGFVPLESRKNWFEFNKACETNKIVQVTYYSASSGQLTIREIEPHRLVESRGAWYVLAWCRLRNELRQFALHRIQEFEVRSESFEPRAGLDIDKYLEEVFLLEHGDQVQRYVIKFDAHSARYVRERTWHTTQEIMNHQDGGCILSFNAARLDEVKRWVLVFGASAEVLEPKELRDVLREEFGRAHNIYAVKQDYFSFGRPSSIAAQTVREKKPRAAKYSTGAQSTSTDANDEE